MTRRGQNEQGEALKMSAEATRERFKVAEGRKWIHTFMEEPLDLSLDPPLRRRNRGLGHAFFLVE
jgi:hypothetical protein